MADQPKIEIILNKSWAQSHIYIDGKEIPVFDLELEPLNGGRGNQLVKVRMTVMPDILKIDPSVVTWLKKEIETREEEGVSPIEVVKFEENLKHLPVSVLKDILSETLIELDKRGVKEL